ncbi:hypothetical protein BDAP_000764 [Binucleata daphniae]
MKNDNLLNLTKPHIESYNNFIDLFPKIVKNVPEHEFIVNKKKLKVKIVSVSLDKPYIGDRETAIEKRVLPKDCRLKKSSYRGRFFGTFEYTYNNTTNTITKQLGFMPIMLRSKYCHLYNNTCKENISCGEDENEIGGYFVVNGNDKVVRLTIAQKRNYIFSLLRDSNCKKGQDFSQYSVAMRCVGEDEVGQMLFLHYLNDGNVVLRLYYRKREFYIPVMLIINALIDTTDEEIFNSLFGNRNNKQDKKGYNYERHGSSINANDIINKIQRDTQTNDTQTNNELNNFKFIDSNTNNAIKLYFNDESQSDNIYTKRIQNLLCSLKDFGIFGQKQCLEYIGQRFKVIINESAYSDEETGRQVIERLIAPHVKDYRDKYNFLIIAIKKLYKLADNQRPDNPDSQMNHEIVTVGQVFCSILKERLFDCLKNIGRSVYKIKKYDTESISNFMKNYSFDVCQKFDYLLSTGNLQLNIASDITETAGLTILAEKLNFFRFISHFRSVNRGNFFAQLKTTTVRKLKPESWGFFCPVHTPDGTPCGIITHLSHKAEIITKKVEFSEKILYEHGLIPTVPGLLINNNHIEVLMDGKLIGYIDNKIAIEFVSTIRRIRNTKQRKIEVVYFAKDDNKKSMYPFVCIFTGAGRLMRPVLNSNNEIEYIGIMEQVFLHIEKAIGKDIVKDYSKIEPINESDTKMIDNSNDKSMHNTNVNTSNNKIKSIEHNIVYENMQTNTLFESYKEILPTDMFSVVASLTPFSDFNQSPRNMYQCQMAKQTMGTAFHNARKRNDNKAYRISYPQKPLIRTQTYNNYNFDDYPMGTNAVVAVLSYTGYDMEDAMVINKSSMERGFFYGSVFKTEVIEIANREDQVIMLPDVGKWLGTGDLFYKIQKSTGEIKSVFYKRFDKGLVESVNIFNKNDNNLFSFSVKIRIPRNPNIGDKFCSRHGQKGVCSMHWPVIDMPFTEDGIVPDIIINPHAFPSRMTIGMLIESMAGKSGCLNGKTQNGTAFQFNADKNIDDKQNGDFANVQGISAIDYFGKELEGAGYNYYGNETMYSGVTGDMFKAEVFIGVVYYQRLRHMVNDKFQVRTTGSVQTLTKQPVGGRKNKGGVRLGEMERDALIAHGVSSIIQDRLQYSSDFTNFLYCVKCSSILFVANEKCFCGGHEYKTVGLPYAFKYLCSELMSMNIKVKLDI